MIYILLVFFLHEISAGSVIENLFNKTDPNFVGRLVATGDFTNDRFTDVVVYNDTKLLMYKQSDTGEFVDPPLEVYRGYSGGVECAVGDFDRNEFLDLLVQQQDKDGLWRVDIFWGDGDDHKTTRFTPLLDIARSKQQVAAIDVDGDGSHDILGVHPNGTVLCIMHDEILDDNPTKNLSKDCSDLFPGWNHKLHPEMPVILADVDGDLVADLLFNTVDDNGDLVIEVWNRTSGGGWKYAPGYLGNKVFKNALSPMVADFNRNGAMEVLVPSCADKHCDVLKSTLDVWENGFWTTYQMDNIKPGSKLIKESGTRSHIRVGDFDLDQYPDLTFGLDDGVDGKTYMILRNQLQEGTKDKRKFELFDTSKKTLPWEVSISQLLQSVHLFDLREDGQLDLIFHYRVNESTTNQSKFIIYSTSGAELDSTFLKVELFTPTYKSNEWKSGTGITWNGGCMRYEMESNEGTAKSMGCQMMSSSHRTFEVHFVLFGLGRNPNFVEGLTVGAPREYSNLQHHKVTQQIVPNARILMLPAANEQHSYWYLRLFLTYSSYLLKSIVVLVSICIVLLLVVLFLHYREKREDRAERQAQSHRFHFDAM